MSESADKSGDAGPRGPGATGELDPRDYSRRTLLANERTFLAWWRTGLTSITAGLAAAQVIPRLADTDHRWAYTALGLLLAVAGTIALAYGHWRRLAVDRAIRRGEFAEASAAVTAVLTTLAVVAGIGLIVLIVVGD
jgi:putative membrane protein